MPRIRLNQRTLEALKVDGKWLTDYWDEGLPGFGVRVAHSGLKTFVVRYDHDGRKRRVTIGPYPAWKLADARDKAKEILYAADRGEDPQAKKKAERQALTFGELADEYLERHAKLKKRRWKEDERVLQVDLLPHWGKLKAKNIQRRDVNEILDGIVERGAPIMANRVRALISKMYNFGLGRDLVEHNPCLGVAMPAPVQQRERVLSDEEIRAVWGVLEAEEPLMAATFKLRLVTAQRGVEVLTMRWSDIDGEWWTIPAEVVKNKLNHRVPLSRQALTVLDKVREITGDKQWVFASPRRPDQPISAVQKAAERIATAAQVEFVPHDLRRTAASHMTSIGISRLVVSKILNHVEQGVTAIYDRHSYDGEKREALTRWGNRLEAILSGKPGQTEDPEIRGEEETMNQDELLSRITVNPTIFGGKPIVRGRRLAVEHVLGMLAAGDSFETLLGGYPWLEPEDIQACLVYERLAGDERVESLAESHRYDHSQ